MVAVTSRATRKAPYCNGVPPVPHLSATVVIPTRNRLPLLKETVASVFAQRGVDWRVIVVDDASTDDTPAWLADLARDGVQFIRCDEGVERSAARNLGLERVETPYVLFLDDDDVLQPGALAALARGLHARPEAFAAAGARALFDHARHIRRMPWPRWKVCRKAWPEILAGWIPVGGQTLLRTELVREVGGWKDGMIVAEDQELWLRLAYTRPAVLVPGTVLRYRLHGLPRAPWNTRIVERELREQFVGGLPASDRLVGEQAIVAWRTILESNRAFFAHEHRRAIRLVMEVGRTAPWLLTSPITGPGLLASLAKGLAAGALPRPAGIVLEFAVDGTREVLGLSPRSRTPNPEKFDFYALPFEEAATEP